MSVLASDPSVAPQVGPSVNQLDFFQTQESQLQSTSSCSSAGLLSLRVQQARNKKTNKVSSTLSCLLARFLSPLAVSPGGGAHTAGALLRFSEAPPHPQFLRACLSS